MSSAGDESAIRRDTRWWGWGGDAERGRVPSGGLDWLRERLGLAERRLPPPELDRIELPDPGELPERVRGAVAERFVLTSSEDRVRHAAGKSYLDLIRLRLGRLDNAPDAVVLPGDGHELQALLEACSAERIAVVPFGGGTSVVGGVDPFRDGFGSVISLDLSRMRRVEVDRVSLTARLGPGLRGPEAETALRAQGLTLGHFPQSYEYATVGGFAATRSAGQASAGYGRFDELVTSIRLQAPAGELATLEVPHTAAGPALRELIVGSEGTLGVISEVGVRVRPAPQSRRYEGWMAGDFASGVEIVRELAQRDALPDVIRLSDPDETSMSLNMAGGGLAARALDSYLRLRRRRGGCVVIAGFEGEREAVSRRRALAERGLRGGGAVPLGAAAGRSWERGRYAGPYWRDDLIGAGVMVETLETAHTWSRLEELYRAVGGATRSALEAQGTPGIVLCHLSHPYRDGASLYFTFLAAQREGEEVEQWQAVKSAACDAIVACEATITHHHAIGRDHAPYMRAEIGELGLELLRSAKAVLDPEGVMNPGKLLGAG